MEERDITNVTLTSTLTAYRGGGNTILLSVPKKILDALKIYPQSILEVTFRNTGMFKEKLVRPKKENQDGDA